MSTVQEQNKALIRDTLARIDAGDRDVLREVYSPDVVVHFPGSPPLDFDATMSMAESFFGALPDFKHHIQDLIAEGDKVVLRVMDEGTHLGEFQGVAPTGKKVSFSVIGIFKIRDGKIVELWEEFDMLGFLQQMGVMPEIEAAGV